MDSVSQRSFFEFKTKKNKNTHKISQHSRSLSANSNFAKNSARSKGPTYFTPLTKKQKQIRQAIHFRFQKSKIRKYVYEPPRSKSSRKAERSRSSEMKEYQHLKNLKYINLKLYHSNKSKCKTAKSKKLDHRNSTDCMNRIKSQSKKKGNTSVVIKTEASEKSVSKVKMIKKGAKEDWKFIRIEQKGKRTKSKYQKNQLQIKSHRTLTITEKSKSKSKIGERKQKQYDFVPKLYNLSRIHQKFKF